MTTVLVVNSGSSSLKYRLVDTGTGRALAGGIVERIGEDGLDHTAAVTLMLEAIGGVLAEHPPVAVGHRVVHGGDLFIAPTLITDAVEADIDALADLAPLHNPGALLGIRAARRAFPALPHVAVFDTAFHQTLPPEAYTYAIDREVAREHRIRRYGFHGTSHQYVSERAAAFVGRDVRDLKQIVFHLGNGASVTAVDGGRSVETSMGMTPLEGLVMGTRSGDLDPAILLYLARTAGLSVDDLDVLLNRRSGMLGLAGVSDMRDVGERRDAGDPAASLAFDVYVHRLRAYAGAYLAQLGGVDVISFTAGVGENAPRVRAAAMATLGFAGVEIDEERNQARRSDVRAISTDASAVTVLVVPTDEELAIARLAREFAG